MDDTRWDRLSSWHNRWLAADAAARTQLEGELRTAAPDLVDQFTDLIRASPTLDAFLETPAFVAAARRMARELPQLSTGAIVGPYRIGDLVARGGMGTVYRAHDTRLHRDVALKVLDPVEPATDGALDRFLREARLTASIDHPNVVRLYDVGVVDHQPYLVMEWLDGQTLRSRLAGNALAVPDVLRMARDVARGLGAAHAAGLVHRDLKPENVLVTRAGDARILDFGIAKLLPSADRPADAAHTVTNFLVGTAGYLAPEQIRGDTVDARADLFALGAMLFEALTGQRAFVGTSTVDTLHATLHAAPPDVPARAGAPPALMAIARRLLEKSPADRFQSAADLLWALDHLDEVGVPARPAARHSGARHAIPVQWMWAAAACVVLAAAGVWWFARPTAAEPSLPLTRFSWALPDGTDLRSAPVVSPDGSRIAWAATGPDAVLRLYVRDLAADDAAAIAGTEGARQPFWAPTSASLGFFAGGKLKKVALGGGTPVVLADAPDPRGGSWGAGGVIVFQPLYRDMPLMQVPDRGGPVEPASVLRDGEVAHRWPAFLPDGDHFLFSVANPDADGAGIHVGQLSASTRTHLFATASNVSYVPGATSRAGLLVSVAHDRVEVRRFDAQRLRLDGDATMIAVPAVPMSPHHAALVSASPDVLAVSRDPVPWGVHLARARPDGSDLAMDPERMLGGFPRVSPDGRLLAVSRVDIARVNPDIWIDDLTRGTRLRVTASTAFDVVPVWSPDGRQVAFRTGSLTSPSIGVADADGSGPTRTLPCPSSPCEPSDWMADQQALLITVRGRDVWRLPLDPGVPPHPVLDEPFVERDARVSPDGRWMIYVSDETGRAEVYVRPVSGAASRTVVSASGGDQPAWDRAGDALYFVNPAGRLVRTGVRLTGPTVDVGASVTLGLPRFGDRHWGTTYDVGPDGFVHFPLATTEAAPRALDIVLGWQRLVATAAPD